MTFLITILVRTCFEEGAVTGIKVFLNLNWEALGILQVTIFIITYISKTCSGFHKKTYD